MNIPGLHSNPASPVVGGALQVMNYERSNRWVGRMNCANCHYTVWAWRSSKMGDCWPHFYCTKCSNAIHRKADQFLAWANQSARTLGLIAATLPPCPCGGQFRPGARPKCPVCRHDFPNSDNPVSRLTDPTVVVLHGACLFSDMHGPFRVCIEDESGI